MARERVLWSAAVGRAEVLFERCRGAASAPVVWGHDRQVVVERWALPVYAIAGETGRSVDSVSAAQVRYRVDDRDEYGRWLGDRLAWMGHPVAPLTVPDFGRGITSDVVSLAVMQHATEQARSPLSDDPVAARWRQETLVTAGSSETTCGAVVDLPPRCELWAYRSTMIELLDALLLVERGGWRPGTPVRTVGVPTWIRPDGCLATEAGVSGERAEVGFPVWPLDHEAASLAEGPPVAHHLLYRALDSGVGMARSTAPVPAEALVLDLAAFPDTGTPLTPPRMSVGDGTAAWHRSSREESAAGRSAFSTGAAASEGTGVPGVPDDVEPARAAAIMRLWAMRDRELALCGDSRPLRLAQRMAAGWLDDERPPSSATLLAEDKPLRDDPPAVLAPWCAPDRELVVGRAREHLRQWLHALRWPTRRQRAILDGLGEDPSLSDTLVLLAEEGFVEAARAPAWKRRHETPGEEVPSGASGPDGVDVVLVNAELGWVATVHAPDQWGRGPEVAAVCVHYNAAVLDRGLVIPELGGRIVQDRVGRRTNVSCGGFRTDPRSGLDGYGHSLRVGLAVLRAFTDPVLPWLEPTGIAPGADGAPATWQRRLLASLPREVHELFGPNLLADTPGPSSS